MRHGGDGGRRLDAREAGLVERASDRLRKLPLGAPLADVLDAIRPCVPPLAAGLLSVLRPEAPSATVTCPVWLDAPVLESWLAMPDELRALTIAPIFAAVPGDLRRDSETVPGPLRERIDVFSKLDASGLGEGAGYKVMEGLSRSYGEEHVLLAMLMERRAPVPARAGVLLGALHPAISAAILRTRLPLLSTERLRAQIVAEPGDGYLCVSRSGSVIEVNGKAHDLVTRFRDALGVSGGRSAVAEFAARAPELAGRSRTWAPDGNRPRSILQVRTHALDKETQDLHEDVLVMVMEEIACARSRADELIERAGLTRRQKEIAYLLAHTPLQRKEIAEKIACAPRTVDKHVEAIFGKLRKLGVQGPRELMTLAAE